jgi:hypothetical protein
MLRPRSGWSTVLGVIIVFSRERGLSATASNAPDCSGLNPPSGQNAT